MKCHPVIIRLRDQEIASRCKDVLLINLFEEGKDFVFVTDDQEIEGSVQTSNEYYPQRLVIFEPFETGIHETSLLATKIKKASSSTEVIYVSSRRLNAKYGIVEGFFKNMPTNDLFEKITMEIHSYLRESLPPMSVAA